MMDFGEVNAATKPPIGRRMKSRAPPPPPAPEPAPRRIFRNAVPDGGGQGSMDTKENILRPNVDLHITLPQGYQTTSTVDGSKALMDLLVDLCSQYHLNPAYNTLELLSSEGLPLPFKPNALLGTLDVACVLIKEKVWEEKVVRKPPPKVPEKTVRLVVNYHRSQKTVVRVNPLAPLESLVPAICEKCEFKSAHVLLLKDNVSNHELELDKSLTQLGIRELYVLDQTLESIRSHSSSISGSEKKGLLGFLKFNRRRSKTEEQDMDDLDDNVIQNTEKCSNGLSTVSICAEDRPSTLGQSQSVMNISRMSPKVEPKKRRAPAPPAPTPYGTQYSGEAYQVSPGSPRSDSQLRKRKAPAPPPTPTSVTPAPDTPDSTDAPDTPIASSPAPSTTDPSLPGAEDSGSELSHSTEDSASSVCSSSSSVVATTAPSAPSTAGEAEAAGSTTSEDTESALDLKLEEMENNRHSAIGTDRQVPLKPRRTPTREPQHQLVVPPPPSSPPPPSAPDSLDTSPESHMEGPPPQSWLHSPKESEARQTPDQEAETLSTGSSSSFPDQGYAASEGMAEDSGLVGSPSDVPHPTSPDGSLSAHPLTQPKDCSSDSDEGCATWGSGHRHSSAIDLKDKSGKAQDSFEEDPELTAQLNQTLADLEADLADISHIDAVPVSVVDMDVPVTAIDEVLDDYGQSMTADEAALPSSTPPTHSKLQSCGSSPSGEVQNQNNNARTSDGQKKAGAHRLSSQEKKKKLAKSTEKEEKHTTVSPTKTKTETKPLPVRGTLGVPERTGCPLPTSHSTESAEEEETPAYRGHTPTTQGKITHIPVSRFGTKTFTVTPPKPAVTQTQPQKAAIPPTTGAIKIDEQGNMVKVGTARNKFGGSSESLESPLLGKAKAFWSSTEKQDALASTTTARGSVTKARETEVPRTTAPPEPAEKATPKEAVKDVVEVTKVEPLQVESKAPVPEPTQQPMKPLPVFSEQKRDLSFLKPQRRTSSQYVASAITKYAVKTSAKADHNIQEIRESSVSMKKGSGSYGYQNEGQSIRVHPFQSSHTSTSVSGKKESSSGSHPAGPKRSMSYPDYMTEKQLGSAQSKPQGRGCCGSTLQPGSKSFDSDTANASHAPSSTSQPQKTLPPPHSPTKQVPVLKPSQDLPPAHSTREMTRPALAKKPEPAAVTNVLPEPNQVTLFGPVKKFKPVILKSVNKETTLHSTLMEAIQSGDQKRLRKTSDSSASTCKKPSFVEEENERSALLSALRAQSNKERLKKTKSQAADDLEKCKKIEVESSAQCDTMPPPPSFVPPLPPLPPAMVPPPPPPPSTQPKPTAVLGSGGNPAMAREAMMEAIRSGSAAERLKKVTAAPKTIQVNGRLGTIHATSSSLSQGQ